MFLFFSSIIQETRSTTITVSVYWSLVFSQSMHTLSYLILVIPWLFKELSSFVSAPRSVHRFHTIKSKNHSVNHSHLHSSLYCSFTFFILIINLYWAICWVYPIRDKTGLPYLTGTILQAINALKLIQGFLFSNLVRANPYIHNWYQSLSGCPLNP